jgi:UDP-N-acetylmuramyl pentapeptide phosphotransferase/UDP-N-acetylglucosamine-1-phosphate transferase
VNALAATDAVQVLLVALVASCVASPLAITALRRTDSLDVPNHRSSHTVPTPRGGGIACVFGVVAGAWAGPSLSAWPAGLRAALAGSLALAVVGLSDDRRGLPPAPRLVAQAAVGAACGGVVGMPDHPVLWSLVGLVLVPAVVNMVNFMDGVNGMCAGHTVLWGSAAILVGVSSALPTLVLLGLLAAGAFLGFLPWNFPRARVFLGDVGSYLAGGLVSTGILLVLPRVADGEVPVAPLLAPMLLFAVDTGSTVVRRARAGQPLLQPHREHVYQRLVNEGGRSHPTVVAAMLIAGSLVVATMFLSPVLGTVVAVAVSVLYLAAPTLQDAWA